MAKRSMESIVMASESPDFRAANPELFGDAPPEPTRISVKDAKEMVEVGQFITVSGKNQKYRNHIVVYHCAKRGILVFASAKEFRRYQELSLMEDAGDITDLEMQRTFVLVDAGPFWKRQTYRADYVYIENGKTVIEDVKGAVTRLWECKWAWMQTHKDYKHYTYKVT